jgi:flagellar hook-basal body complex protein FliE
VTSPLGGIVPVGVGAIGGPTATSAVPTIQPGEGGDGFAATLAAVFDQLQGAQNTSNQLATQAATGDLRDVHDYMIASAEAGLATEMVVTVKNKAVEAFNEIMRMPV